MHLRQVRTVAGFELGRLCTNVHGLVFAATFLFAAFGLSLKLHEISGKLAGVSMVGAVADAAKPEATKVVYKILAWWTNLGDDAIRDLLLSHPPTLLVFFVLGIVGTATWAMFLACDQMSSEIRSRHLRYLLVRIDRRSLYLGKTLGVLLFYFACVTAASGMVAAAVATSEAGIGGTSGALYMVRIWLSLLLYSVPFVALMSLTSAMLKHPLLALVLGHGLWFGLWVAGALGGLADPVFKNVRFAFPTAFKYHLLSDQVTDVALAASHMLAFAVLFWLAGLWVFSRRDV